MTNALERLVEQLRRLPGIGSKSARRLAYHLVEMPKEEVDRLVETIVEAKGLRVTVLFALTYQLKILVNSVAIRTAIKRRLWSLKHLAMSLLSSAVVTIRAYITYWKVPLSPMEGIGADDIRVKELIARLRDGVVQEVILATDPDVEGEATALYLARLLSPSGIKVTRIARGVPVGGDIEYADELTLGGAVVNRQEMKG